MIGELGLLTLAVIAIYLWWARRHVARRAERNWRPPELEDAKLAFAERTFRIWTPVALVARVDRAYRSTAGVNLVEFKTRFAGRVYRSDVIELSVQKLAIEEQREEKVSEIGFVLTQSARERNRTVHRVKLLSKREVVDLVRRREALLDGREIPGYAESTGLCVNCGFRRECEPPRLNQG